MAYANAQRAFQYRRMISGVCEDIADRQTQWDLIRIIEDTVGGYWNTTSSLWESRRESMLDLLGKAAPFAFTPALQIDPDANYSSNHLAGGATRRIGGTAKHLVARGQGLFTSSVLCSII
ncbi:MAG TPA: hypothetical protein VFX54_21820 [Candidatus Binatia bacterium]|nr:hypothetical protein [Candidatus Binatia bacterium]